MNFTLILLGILMLVALKFQKAQGLLRKVQTTLGVLLVLTGILLTSSPVHSSVQWDVYDPKKIERAKQDGVPVIIDFHAEWCVPCHQLDEHTYSSPQVVEALDSFVKLKADMTDPDLPEVQEMIERFSIDGVPTILFLDRQGREIEESRISGFLEPEDFLHQMASEDFKARTSFT